MPLAYDQGNKLGVARASSAPLSLSFSDPGKGDGTGILLYPVPPGAGRQKGTANRVV
jgi:hypothetical protein